MKNENNSKEKISELSKSSDNVQSQTKPSCNSVKCCIPNGPCFHKDEQIDLNEPEDAVRIICSNDACTKGNFMHHDCFNQWEQTVLGYLKNCSRARSWSEKQRVQNIWTKKGYDLVFKACECTCKRGHLKKDLDYIPGGSPVDNASKKRRCRRRTGELNSTRPNSCSFNSHGSNEQLCNATSPAGGGNPYYPFHHHHQNSLNNHYNSNSGQYNNRRLRSRQMSNSSNASTGTFSSSPLDEFSPPLSPDFPLQEEETGGGTNNRGLSRQQQQQQTNGSAMRNSHRRNSGTNSASVFPCWATANGRGNMFHQRLDYNCFKKLSFDKQNSYFIHMEDDSCNGNDDVKSFILSVLTAHRAVNVHCLICQNEVPVYDHFPLINGTFFLSPICHAQSHSYLVDQPGEHHNKHLHVLCINCLEKSPLACRSCQKRWTGNQLLIGSMYVYDIFAAVPCCLNRLGCNSCGKPVDSPDNIKYFSQYSKQHECSHCHSVDFHFVKRFTDCYVPQQSLAATSSLVSSLSLNATNNSTTTFYNQHVGRPPMQFPVAGGVS